MGVKGARYYLSKVGLWARPSCVSVLFVRHIGAERELVLGLACSPSLMYITTSVSRSNRAWTTSIRTVQPHPHPSAYHLSRALLYISYLSYARRVNLYSIRDSSLIMFSGSNSYLGGGNSARQPQYGQQAQQPQQYGQAGGFQGGLGPQPTGFGGGSIQAQYTGMPGQQQGFGQQQPQQPMYTGYPGQSNQFQQNQAPQQQQFQTGAPQQQQQLPAQPQRPQPTGMTSSQMADSFRGSSSASSVPPPVPAKSNKIPNIRLSFITAQDQAKFEQLFKSAVGDAQALSGDQARDLLMRSKLSGDALSQIW